MALIPRGPGNLLDERFFDRRRRSSSVAGIAGGVFAGVLFLYRLYANGRVEWDLFAVLAAFVGIKLGMMLWYYITD